MSGQMTVPDVNDVHWMYTTLSDPGYKFSATTNTTEMKGKKQELVNIKRYGSINKHVHIIIIEHLEPDGLTVLVAPSVFISEIAGSLKPASDYINYADSDN